MILVVGGQGSGKRDYVRSLGYSEGDFTDADTADAAAVGRPVFADLHLYLRDRAEAAEELVDALLQKEVVVCNEIGCGIVPADAEERAYRDRVGRVCALLAARARRVVRVCCGIPVCIKDNAGAEGGAC